MGLSLLTPSFPALARSNVAGGSEETPAGDRPASGGGGGAGCALAAHPRLLIGLGLLMFALYVGAKLAFSDLAADLASQPPGVPSGPAPVL